jgi:Fe-S-cluster containining protein
MNSEYFSLFKELRDKVDSKCNDLLSIHKKNMYCRRFCSKCCQLFKILPIEFHFIQENICDKNIAVNQDFKKDECKFLVNKECSIYEYRPIICRTHGYPLARFNDEAGAYEISYCDLNFKTMKLDDFNNENVFYEDDTNNEFYELNKAFIKNLKANKYDMIELLAVNNIKV